MSSLFKNSHELRQHLKEHPSLTPPGMSLGNLLLECGVITPSQLEKALSHQHEHPELGRLGQVLLELKMISAERLGLTLAQQLGIAQVSLENFDIQPECLKLVPESLARRYLVVPLMLDGERLIVASPDPTRPTASFCTCWALSPANRWKRYWPMPTRWSRPSAACMPAPPPMSCQKTKPANNR